MENLLRKLGQDVAADFPSLTREPLNSKYLTVVIAGKEDG